MNKVKHRDLKELLIKAISDDLSDDERLLLETEALPEYEFSDDFASGVMTLIGKAKNKINYGREFMKSFDTAFIRIAITGIAAIVVLAISILINQGSLSYDTLLGIDGNMDDSLISLLVE